MRDTPPAGVVEYRAVQISHRDLAETVAASLRGSGLDPGCLTLEITESVTLTEGADLTDVLSALKALGVRGWCWTTSGPATPPWLT